MPTTEDPIGTAFNPDGLTLSRPGEAEVDEEGQPVPFALRTDAERRALAFFVEHEEELYDAIVEALKTHVREVEVERRRKAEIRDREAAQHRAHLLGDTFEADEGVVVEEEVRDLFDDPEDFEDPDIADDELDDDEPFWNRFTLDRLVLLPGVTLERSAIGLMGEADWDPNGVGIVLEGREVEAIGDRSVVM